MEKITFLTLFTDFAEFLLLYRPIFNFALAIIVFLVFWGLKKKFTKLLGKIITKLVNRKKQWFSKEAIESALVPCNSVFALLGAYLALDIVNLSTHPLVLSSFRIAVIALLAWILVRFWDSCAGLLFEANETLGQELSLNLNKTLVTFLKMAIKVLIVVIAVLAILKETGVDVTALITGLGLGGLTFALAAQDTASNLFSGVVILLDKPFMVDDWIQTPDLEGTVEEITFRSTRIRTFTNAQIIVPNSTLTGKPITNWSRMPKRRATFTIGLEYSTTSEQIQNCIAKIENLLANHPEVVENSAVVNFDGFGSSSLNISVLYHCKQTGFAGFSKVREEINFEIMQIIEGENCSFAYPTQTLYIKNNEITK